MSDSVAEAYLLILRPSMVPVAGEAVPFPFEGQIEIDEWSWSLENEVYAGKKKDREKLRTDEKDELKRLADIADDQADKAHDEARDSLRRLQPRITALQKDKRLSEADRAQEIRKLIDATVSIGETEDQKKGKEQAGRKKAEDEDAPNDDLLKFTFKKNVDAASTQLLNSLKSGDKMPRAIITLFHRSANAPVTLAIKFENVRLKSFTLSVDPSDTMTDLKEEWTANYESMEYSYQNRPAASGPNGLTKGTVRVFKQKRASLL